MISFNNIPDKPQSTNTTSIKFKQDIIEFFKDKNLNTCLEIGTNDGWTTRILSSLFEKIYTVEYNPDVMNRAKQNNSDINNIMYYVGDAYNPTTFIGMPKMDVVFIDCVHTYDAVIHDINTSLSLMDTSKGMYFIFDDYGLADGRVKSAILKSIDEGLKVEAYIGQKAGYAYRPTSILIDHEGIILSYGKN